MNNFKKILISALGLLIIVSIMGSVVATTEFEKTFIDIGESEGLNYESTYYGTGFIQIGFEHVSITIESDVSDEVFQSRITGLGTPSEINGTTVYANGNEYFTEYSYYIPEEQTFISISIFDNSTNIEDFII